jgi:N-carbamoylputrescine amidase
MREVGFAAVQFAMSEDRDANIVAAEALVERAAGLGAQVILLPELFQTPYFCADQQARHLAKARPLDRDPGVAHFRTVARRLGVVLPVSFYEDAGAALFNTVAMIDADGTILGRYRKTHIPQNPGYEEKFYFTPGDTGFVTFATRFGRLGVGICWDQWFPECARALALAGAEAIFYPTAIGSEPADPGYDSAGHWRRVMQGHAAANLVPVVAANRTGAEDQGKPVAFYGTSFIADATGAVLADLGRDETGVALARVDLDALAAFRRGWGTWRDRRPDTYGTLASHGSAPA